MRARIDITGQKYRHWTAVTPVSNITYGGKSLSAWLCRCVCGVERVLPTEHLKAGTFHSCGCLKMRPGKPKTIPRPCGVRGCSKPHAAKGYCISHYTQWREHGDPLVWVQARKGEGHVTSSGYRFLRGKREHRTIMERVLGRSLTNDESVHHINGDRADNRTENLELWSKKQPAGQRVQDKRNYARDLLTQYGHLYPDVSVCATPVPIECRGAFPSKWGLGCIQNGYRMLSFGARRVYEHRLVMEQLLGRGLLEHENVHHINGDRLDNRVDNLELWTTQQPSGQRVEDKVVWARSFLAQYTADIQRQLRKPAN